MLNNQNKTIQVITDIELLDTGYCEYGYDCSTIHDWIKLNPTRNARKNILTFLFVKFDEFDFHLQNIYWILNYLHNQNTCIPNTMYKCRR